MRLVFRQFDKNGDGEVGLIPETNEDMWHCYNLIQVNDTIKASTVRKVQTESSTGSKDTTKVRTTLTIQIESIDFDANIGLLRLKGRNIVENKFVKMGAYHTLDLELNSKFTLGKLEWDFVAIDRIEKACNPVHSAEVAAVVLQEGLANVCLITDSMTLVRQRIEPQIPRKRKGDVTQYEKGMQRFFEQILMAILNPNHINFSVIKCLIVASPGFVKEQLRDYILKEAVRRDIKLIMDNQSKFLLVHSSSGHVHSLNEVLKDPTVIARLSDTKAAAEVKALDAFYNMMNEDPLRAYYGYKHVKRACDNAAIDTLLISDELFRARVVGVRRRYVELVEAVQKGGGKCFIFSSAHFSGEQLGKLSGIAALLRFPMEEEEEEEEEVEEGDKEIREMEEALEREREEREQQRKEEEKDFERRHHLADDQDEVIDGDSEDLTSSLSAVSIQSQYRPSASPAPPSGKATPAPSSGKSTPTPAQQPKAQGSGAAPKQQTATASGKATPTKQPAKPAATTTTTSTAKAPGKSAKQKGKGKLKEYDDDYGYDDGYDDYDYY